MIYLSNQASQQYIVNNQILDNPDFTVLSCIMNFNLL